VVFDLVTYVYFPHFYDSQAEHPHRCENIIIVKTLVVAGWLGYLLWRPDSPPRHAAQSVESAPGSSRSLQAG